MSVVFYALLANRIHVHGGIGQILELMEQSVVHFQGNIMARRYRKTRIHGYVDLSQNLVAKPTGPHLCTLFYTVRIFCHNPDIVGNCGFSRWKTDFAVSTTIRRIATEITNPTIGSVSGYPI